MNAFVSPKTLTGSPLVSTFAFETDLPEGVWTIRTVQDVNGDPWFVAKDVCEVLGLENVTNACRRLHGDEVSKLNRSKVGMRPGKPAVLVSESGLYKLIMRSDKPVAKPFQDWVTRTVLPAIRKDGMYVLGEEKVATGENPTHERTRRHHRPHRHRHHRHPDRWPRPASHDVLAGDRGPDGEGARARPPRHSEHDG